DVKRVARALRGRGLACGVETGARYVLDGKRKHRPTLVEADALGRAKRLDFLLRCLEIASDLGATTLTLASGPRDASVAEPTALAFLHDALAKLQEKASETKVTLALEPEPGHWPATLDQWRRVRERVPVALALDVMHLSVEAPEPAPEGAVRELQGEL